MPETVHAREELLALEAQYKSLQLLVGELLIRNQELRLEVASLRSTCLSEPAIRPQPRPDR